MDFDYRYEIQWETVFAAASADPIYSLAPWNPNPYQRMELRGIRATSEYSTAAGKVYIPSLWIALGSPGLVQDYRDDYSFNAPSPATSTKTQNPSLRFAIDSKLMSQVFECYGIQSSTAWQSIAVGMVNQFGAAGGTTVPNGGTSYSIGDSWKLSIDFYFKILSEWK